MGWGGAWGRKRWLGTVVVGAVGVLAGCGRPESLGLFPSGEGPGEPPPLTRGPTETPPTGQERPGEPPTQEPSGEGFRPTFHQPLTGSRELTERTTFRVRVPVARAGTRLRFVFRAGAGVLHLHRATVARAGARGELASVPVALTFSRQAGTDVEPGQERVSDPVLFPVEFREELAVSFEVEGHAAVGERALFPFSLGGPGAFAPVAASFGAPEETLVGLSAIEVDASGGECVAVVGGGARLGSESGDWRETWPAVAERLLGVPVLDLGALEGEEDARRESEVLRRCGRVRCVVLPEGHAVEGTSAPELQDALARTLERLRSGCEVRVGTR